MKMKHLLPILILPFLLFSCKKDDSSYTQIKTNENLIFLAIKAYRTDKFDKMANDAEEFGTRGLTEHWNEIHEKIGGYNDQAIVLYTDTDDEDIILTQLLQIDNADLILLGDVTQCGVGVESDSDGYNYVTIMLMKVDS